MAQTPGASTAQSPSQYHQSIPTYGTPSPHPMTPYPPPKQRQPPNNTSNFSSPQLTNGSLPNTNFYANPASAPQTPGLNAPQVNGHQYVTSPSAQGSPNISNMIPPSTPGAMGPPSKPVEDKPVDVNDLGDVLAGSGVDIREEEANLVGARRQVQSSSYGSTNIPSVADGSSGYFDHPTRGHSVYSQNVPGTSQSFYGAGSINQPAVTEEQLADQTKRLQKEAVRRRAQISSTHVNNSFLKAETLAWHVRSKADTRGVKLPQNQPVGDQRFAPRVTVIAPQQGESLAVVNGGKQPVGLSSDVLSLVSLACKDRVRSLLEHAIWLARARRQTSVGEVPPEFLDIAVGQGPAEEIEIDLSSSAQSKKRSFADTEGDHENEPQSKKVKSIGYVNQDMVMIDSLGEHERLLEEKRIKKRAERNMSALTGQGGSSGITTPGATDGQAGPSLADFKKLSKKELKKATENKTTEAEQHKASNSTASMALGGTSGPSWLKGVGSGSKKKVDWLKSKQPGSTSFSTPPSRATSSTQVPKVTTTAASTTTAPVNQNKRLKYGEGREDAAGSRHLDIRDIIRAMELDCKEKRALARAYNMQDRV